MMHRKRRFIVRLHAPLAPHRVGGDDAPLAADGVLLIITDSRSAQLLIGHDDPQAGLLAAMGGVADGEAHQRHDVFVAA